MRLSALQGREPSRQRRRHAALVQVHRSLLALSTTQAAVGRSSRHAGLAPRPLKVSDTLQPETDGTGADAILAPAALVATDPCRCDGQGLAESTTRCSLWHVRPAKAFLAYETSLRRRLAILLPLVQCRWHRPIVRDLRPDRHIPREPHGKEPTPIAGSSDPRTQPCSNWLALPGAQYRLRTASRGADIGYSQDPPLAPSSRTEQDATTGRRPDRHGQFPRPPPPRSHKRQSDRAPGLCRGAQGSSNRGPRHGAWPVARRPRVCWLDRDASQRG